MQVVASSNSETSKKGLYALGALLRNNADARSQFYSNSGVSHLTELLAAPNQTQQVQLKALNLVADLAQLDLSTKVVTTQAALLGPDCLHLQGSPVPWPSVQCCQYKQLSGHSSLT